MEREPKYLRIILLMLLALAGCGPVGGAEGPAAVTGENGRVGEDEGEHVAADDHDRDHEAEATMLTLPELEAAKLDGSKLRVVATTSIIGDVVGRVGGDAVELTTLMGPGQDPHSYEPAARDLTAVANSHVIFVNGWNLEGGLISNLQNVAANVPLAPVSANILPLAFSDEKREEEHEDEASHAHENANPHVWLNPHLMEQWIENIEQVLTELDPASTALYEQNASAYLAELEDLIAYYDQQVSSIAPERRKLVTSHDSLAYFARQYDFEIVGAVVPSSSTVAEPSASGLAELVRAMREGGVCTIFAETTVSPQLSETVVTELDSCERVQVLTLYTDAVGPGGSGADSYISMMRVNIDTIVEGLR